MVSLISHVSIDFSSIGAVMLVDDAQWQGVLSPLPFLFASQKKEQVKPSFLLFDADGTFKLAVCPIPADQISMLALQLMVPKGLASQRKLRLDDCPDTQCQELPDLGQETGRSGLFSVTALQIEVDSVVEPILLETEGATEELTSPKSHTEPVDDAGAMEVEAPPESHTEPVDDAGAMEVEAPPESHTEPVDDAGAMEVEAPPESHTEPVDDAGSQAVEMPPESHTEPVDDAGAMVVQTAPESCTEQVQGAGRRLSILPENWWHW
ncbi:hypothetical protein AK812_SmicGene19746 [Symbiodinium microadriaticum]|uniref:Uncharacterized protein n=1 Tax=Symbiodinium microadriaticum TaxID=2951 RepID=A0A1Q9DRQ0_SYMMI|nr:hypothetical protein AK812_SmicGene19746 [Symbiodinium microadriaticum]